MYNFEELNKMDEERLKEAANTIGIKKINIDDREGLVYEILENRLVTMPQMHRQMALLRRNLADRKKSLRKITQSVSNAARKQLRKNLLRKRKTQSQKPYSLLPPLMTQQRWLQKAHPNAEAVSLKMLLSLPSLIPVPRSLNQSR